MNETLLRFYLGQALEFTGYCVLLLALGSLVYFLWVFAPGQHPELSIGICIVFAGATAFRATAMYRNFYRARARAIALAEQRARAAAAARQQLLGKRAAWRDRVRRADETTRRLDAADQARAARALLAPEADSAAPDA